ncbi:MAG: double-strand break repair helicase AddA, partial [Alphaproteobacteria bacterium]
MKTPQQRTSAQITGANPNLSVWVSANAGTGKTQVLTDRISRLLLAGTRPERILCLTFTKAAAAEMASRLSQRLGDWAVASDAELTAELAALLGAAPDADMLAPARRLFATTLDTPGGLKIRTIHAFCESLLGRFPIEAGVAPHFSVIDERTAAELMAEAQGEVLTQPHVGAALARISALLNEDDFARLMRELASERGRVARMIHHHGSVDDVARAARTALGLNDDDTPDSIIADAIAGLDTAALKSANDVLKDGLATDKKQAAALTRFLAAADDQRGALFRDPYLGIFFTQKDEPRAKVITGKLGQANPQALAALDVEQQRLGGVIDRLKAVHVAAASDALTIVGAALLQRFESLKEARALLDYDDLIEKTRDLLRTESDVSWVLYKLDGGLDHILVDEAQDTAPDQWQVIESLAGDFFSGEGRSEAPRTIFAVGDEKQSIYSFQGADPHMFGAMKRQFADHAGAAAQDFRDVELVESYRSTESVLKTVDAVFKSDAARDGLTFEDRPIRHIWSRRGQAGRIEVWPTLKPGEALELKPWDAPLDRAPVDSPQDRLANKIAATIRGWLDDGEALPSAGRVIGSGDIMILLQKRGDFAEKMVNALKQQAIPVAGADRMVLTDQLAVMDLLALARFVLLADDDLTLAVVLKGPFIGLDDDDLIKLAPGRDGSLWTALKGDARYGDAATRLGELLGRADFMPPYEFFSELLGPDGGRKALLARLGPEADDPIDEFLNLALDYEREHVPSMQSFVHWIEAGQTQIKRDLEHGHGQVRVMTVHGSKGLQANVVFLPDTCTVPMPQYDPKLKWLDEPEPVLLWPGFKDGEEAVTRSLSEAARTRIEQENRRLLYVAATRARDRLYVCGW